MLSGPATGTTVALTGDELVVGRNAACDLVLTDLQVSARHARLTPVADGVLLEDLGSTNGTLVNGQAIGGPFLLRGGERIEVGDTHLTVVVPWASPAVRDGQTVRTAQPAAPAPTPDASANDDATAIKRLREALTRTTVIAAVAVVTSVAAIALLLSGVLTGDDKPDPGPTTTTALAAATIPEIVAAVAPSTVAVESLRDGRAISGGTGWVLDGAEGLIVTNFHVVDEATTFRVAVDDQPRDATLLAAAPCDDLAVLKVADTSRLQTLALGSQGDLKLGESVVAIGYPVNASRRDQLTATAGIVSVVRSSIDGQRGSPTLVNVVQTDTAFNPGNSGGPLVNSRKQLVGVNTLTLSSSGGRTLQNSNYAIGVDRVKEVVARLRTGKSTAWTGASVTSPENSAALTSRGLPNQNGLLITLAVPGTPAATAGLGGQPSLLVGIDGKRIDANVTTYCEALKDVASGQTVRFTVYQPNSSRTTEVPVALA